MPLFSRKKFRSLTLAKQHKELAALIQLFLEERDLNLLKRYHLYLSWAIEKLPPVERFGKSEKRFQENLLDRFHLHRCGFAQNIREGSGPMVHKDKKTRPSTSSPSVCIYLDRIRYPHNIGSIARTVEAMDLGYLVFPPAPSLPTLSHPQAQKASMETYKDLIWKTQPITECPRPWIALEQAKNSQPIEKITFPKTPFTLIIGNEEEGVSEELLQSADQLVEIEQFGKKKCLNVSCAFAICAQAIRTNWK